MANEVTITVKGREQGAKATMDDSKRQATGLAGSVQRVGESAQGILAAQLFEQIGQGASQFLGQARDATSNLGESMNAVNVTFKESAGGINEIGEAAATSMGLSQTAFNAAAVRFSAFASAVAGPGGDTVKVIEDITQRSSDFASVMNLDVSQAMETFQSGLAGESEPLRQYGIDVSAAAVETFAYANGIAAAGAELTEAQKIQARYGLIMQQTAQMQGDFANTSDGLANSQRILNAELENAQATAGQLMVPALEALNGVLIPVVQGFQNLPGPVQTVVASLVLLGAGILSVSSRIAPMIISMQAAGVSMSTMTAAAGRLVAALGPVALIITGLVFAQKQFEGESIKAGTEVGKLSEDLEHLTETGRVNTELMHLFGSGLSTAGDHTADFSNYLDMAAEKSSSFGAKAKEVWDVFKDGDNAMHDAAERFEQLDAALAAAVESGADGEQILQSLIDTYGLTAEQVEQLRSVLPEYADAQERAGESTDVATAAVEQQIDRLQTLADTLRAQTDPIFAFVDAQNKVEEAQTAVNEAEATFGEGSPEWEAATLALAEAQLALFGATTDVASKTDGSLLPALRRARDAGILSEDAFNQLVDALEDANAQDVDIRVRDDANQARARAEALDRSLRNIDRFIDIIFRYHTEGAAPVGGLNVPTRASGGVVGQAATGGVRSNRVLVGEQGPEIVDLAPGSMVHTAGATQAMLAGAGAGQVLEVRYVSSGDDLIDEIVRRLSFKVRTEAGGSVDVLLGGGR